MSKSPSKRLPRPFPWRESFLSSLAEVARSAPKHMTIVECPQCCSNRAIILNTTPLRARCADCDTTYAIKMIDPQYDAVPQTKHRPGGHKKTKPDHIPVSP